MNDRQLDRYAMFSYENQSDCGNTNNNDQLVYRDVLSDRYQSLGHSQCRQQLLINPNLTQTKPPKYPKSILSASAPAEVVARFNNITSDQGDATFDEYNLGNQKAKREHFQKVDARSGDKAAISCCDRKKMQRDFISEGGTMMVRPQPEAELVEAIDMNPLRYVAIIHPMTQQHWAFVAEQEQNSNYFGSITPPVPYASSILAAANSQPYNGTMTSTSATSSSSSYSTSSSSAPYTTLQSSDQSNNRKSSTSAIFKPQMIAATPQYQNFIAIFVVSISISLGIVVAYILSTYYLNNDHYNKKQQG